MHTRDDSQKSRELAFEEILVLRDLYGDKAQNFGEANEAKTRQLLIDKILRVLSWSDDDFNPEQRAGSTGYVDYLLKADGIPYLVVEGKRTSYTFGPPYKQSKKSVYRLNYLRSAFRQPFSDVLEQAKRYAVHSGVPFAVLTNGGEWILVQLMLSPGFTNLNDLNGSLAKSMTFGQQARH